MQTSLGILETKGFAAAITAADIILQDKSVDLIKVEKAGGGIISFFYKGEAEKMKAAFEKGIREARLVSEIVALNIIAQPITQIEKWLFESNKETGLAVARIDKALEKNNTKDDKKEIEKTKVPERIEIIKELANTAKKIKSSKLIGTTSTIQRLRREALSSAKISRSKETGSRVREKKEQPPINMSIVENLSVHELRKLARNVNDFPIQGREISKANRKELVIYFKELA